jgi:hypothetical protein
MLPIVVSNGQQTKQHMPPRDLHSPASCSLPFFT